MHEPEDYVAFAGTDYLGLSHDERVVAAAVRAAREFGLCVSSSRAAMGTIDLHLLVEARLGRFLGAEDAFAYVSGFLGGRTFLGIHAGTDCEVFIDERSHGSLRLGAHAYELPVTPYRHLDANDLADRLARSTAGTRVVATDGTFGMTGAIPPLVDLARAAGECDATLLVDDAHGVGAMGPTGRGTLEHVGLGPADAVIMGSLSKALGGGGGFLAGPKAVIDRVRRTPPALGATPISPAYSAAAIQAIDIVEHEPERRERLFENADRLRTGLARLGLRTGGEPTPIIPIYFADAAEAQAASAALRRAGILVPWFDYGADDDPGILRAAARAVHTPADIRRFVAALADFVFTS